jgi:TIR domain-containing protein
MPYLAPHFHYDMFMSYAHGHVPGVDDPPLRRWSQAMIAALKADIGSLFTEFDQLTIWDDRSLDPTAALTDELREKIERSCLLLIVMSPRYLSSAWCTDELTWFAREFASTEVSTAVVYLRS